MKKPCVPVVDDEPMISELLDRRGELLAQHLLEVLEPTGMDTQPSASTARALVLARSKAEEILAAAKGEAGEAAEQAVA